MCKIARSRMALDAVFIEEAEPDFSVTSCQVSDFIISAVDGGVSACKQEGCDVFDLLKLQNGGRTVPDDCRALAFLEWQDHRPCHC